MSHKLSERLRELHKLTIQTPLYNPVFQLGLELSREIESGDTSLKDIEKYVTEFECKGLITRAKRLNNLLAPVGIEKNLSSLKDLVLKTAHSRGFEEFSAFWSRPKLHTVFTAHPTFLLNKDQADAVAAAVSTSDFSDGVCLNTSADAITLDYEHAEVLEALKRGGDARDAIIDTILEVAKDFYPKDWKNLRPIPFRFATWVGFDMDGRTDIGWSTSISYRLEEKAKRLELYAIKAKALGLAEIAEKLQKGADNSYKSAESFKKDLTDPKVLTQTANEFTAANKDNILELNPIIEAIETIAKTSDDAKNLISLASSMRADGLGMGQIHFRINSAQLNNAIRNHISDGTEELSNGTTLMRVQELLKSVKPLRSNFAALAIESTTALRQFLAMAQILNHIDKETPIRLLIAECEQPTTVLIALYFAKLFGIDDRVDISPLFETETAMEHGARFLDALLGNPQYRKYALFRKRIAIQTGFSDAGRFVGQIPAALAIERLHGRLARIMAKHDLTNVSALIFNTHGESMGRGAHPVNMQDRLTYPMSEWAREQFRSRGIKNELEVSFQGGDGFLFFRTPELALATLTRIIETETRETDKANDPFYIKTDRSLDFYRGIRRVQRDYLNNPAYARAVTAFGLGLLKDTGSRKSRRQSDISQDRDMNLRQIRAIPHNSVLQQLGYPINIIAGAGTAAREDIEAIAELINQSRRGKQLIRLINASNSLASIKTMAAYGELFNCAYWASRPYRGTESQLSSACLALAVKLEKDDRPGEFRRLVTGLRVDAMRLHQLLDLLDDKPEDHDREEVRRTLGALHALRLALMQHMFLRAAQMPAFSRRNDISRDDVLEMIFSLRINDALDLLRRAFPITAPSLNDFDIIEPTDYPKSEEKAYKAVHEEFFDKIEEAYKLCIRISVCIANQFGAHG